MGEFDNEYKEYEKLLSELPSDYHKHVNEQILLQKEYDRLVEEQNIEPTEALVYSDGSTEAVIRTADSVERIESRFNDLSSDLEEERQDRKQADDKNYEYTMKIDKKNLFWTRLSVFIAIIGFIIGAGALVCSIIALLK